MSVHNAMTKSSLVRVGRICPALTAEAFGARLELEKRGAFLCVKSPQSLVAQPVQDIPEQDIDWDTHWQGRRWKP